MFSQQKFIMISFLLLALLSASVSSLNPTPIQQFLQIPTYNELLVKLWHIGDDIIGFYGLTDIDEVDKSKPEGYLRITPSSSQVQRILDETIASCHQNASLLDRSDYYPSMSTFLYYCVANNSLLLINPKDYTVQEAIPVSTSQIFQEVILGHDEQGHVYILGLPDILYIPTKAPTELILINLTTKVVENHIIFNKDSDSQKLVTGFAFDSDSGVHYILTKFNVSSKTLIEIQKINLTDNDYDLTPFVQFTYKKEDVKHVVHNPLYLISGHLFTNGDDNLVVFDKNGTLVLNGTNLQTYPCTKNSSSGETLWAPTMAAQQGGRTFYASFSNYTARAYSLQNGTINSTFIGSEIDDMKIAVGDTDLMIGQAGNIFYIKEIQTNTTITTSMRLYEKMMVSSSYISFLQFGKLYVFDRQTPEKLLQTLTFPTYNYHDPSTNLLFGISRVIRDCQITYLDLETLTTRTGPLIQNQKDCSFKIVHLNLTNLATPFFVIDTSTTQSFGYLLVSPATYGNISWTPPAGVNWETGVIIPGDAGTSFTYVWTSLDDKYNKSKTIKVNSYKLDKLLKRFVVQDAYNLTTIEVGSQSFKFVPILNDKVVMTYDKKMTILNLAEKTKVDYDVPAYYNSPAGVNVFYDQNKTPYLALSEVANFGQAATLPQLFDFTSFKPVPGAIANVTRKALVIDPCRYSLIDEYNHIIGVIRFFDACNSTQQNFKIEI